MGEGPLDGLFTSRRLGWARSVAVAFTILFAAYVLYATWRNFSDPEGVDFVSFWAAGRLALSGAAATAYDIEAHRAVELTVGPAGLLPFPYPPPFLFFVLPFSFKPFWLAFGLWVVMSALLYIRVLSSTARAPWSLVHPAAHVNVLIGQNGLLTTSLLVGGLNLVSKRPWIAGGILGLMVIKPQLAVLLPFALASGREWRAFAGAAISSLGLLAAALLVFGLSAYQGFFEILPNYARYMKVNAWPWGELASVYAFGRALGISPAISMALQVLGAVGAILVTCYAWAVKHPNRIPIFAASTLLIPPYLLNYDSLLLIVPIGYFMKEKASRSIAFVVWASCLSALGTYLEVYSGPNTVTLGALISLYFLYRPRRSVDQEHCEPNLTPRSAIEAAS